MDYFLNPVYNYQNKREEYWERPFGCCRQILKKIKQLESCFSILISLFPKWVARLSFFLWMIGSDDRGRGQNCITIPICWDQLVSIFQGIHSMFQIHAICTLISLSYISPFKILIKMLRAWCKGYFRSTK